MAQEVRASITGIVGDPSDAPLAGAAVTVTNVAPNLSLTTKTGESGNYFMPFLAPEPTG
ncbi:MAG: carboxypeptidase-like regulatory domain-containing protein [Bryobacterales bacterium]|nr:carboxypeptidase-like regulatory domain-containing protein [Bryobacterales bacterium]